jgi:fatty acid desaturase
MLNQVPHAATAQETIEPPDTMTLRGSRGSDYAQLSRRIRAAGLLDRRPGYYCARIALVTGSWVGGWTVFALLGASWWQLGVAAFMAVVCSQAGFLGHDAGHSQVFASRRTNEVLGLFAGNVLAGLSYLWWVDKHNRHHAHPNKIDADPDIAGAGIAFTPDQARARSSAAGRWVARHQAELFFPMLLLEGLDLHLSSVRALVARRKERNRRWWLESTLLGAHFVGYLAAVFLVLPIGQAFAFIAVHQALLGLYLGCTFAPSHKGMPLIDADDTGGRGSDFLRRQVLTSRNINGGRWLDVAMGGLNHQIEHHLFPSMPVPALRPTRAIVREYCAEQGLPYLETSLIRSYALALGYLHEVGNTSAEPALEPAAG